MKRIKQFFWNNQKGAAAVEYGLLVALIAAVIITVVALLGLRFQAAFQTVLSALGAWEH